MDLEYKFQDATTLKMPFNIHEVTNCNATAGKNQTNKTKPKYHSIAYVSAVT